MRVFLGCIAVFVVLGAVTGCKDEGSGSTTATDSISSVGTSSQDVDTQGGPEGESTDSQTVTLDEEDTQTGSNAPEAPRLNPGPWYECLTEPAPEGVTIVSVFDAADQYFNPEDKRNIDATVDFPESGSWQRIDLRLELSCPEDGDCDNWDRFANVMLVENPGEDDEEVVELERYITPYNIAVCFQTDVTGFASLLKGERTIRSFIDTWVGPNEKTHGHGWRVSLEFIFYPGLPDLEPSQLLQLWPYQNVKVGDPDNTTEGQLTDRTVEIPSDMTRAELRFIATGHGQGNAGNCAEFCRLHPVVDVNKSISVEIDPWRFDCSKNPLGSKQMGTWTYNRLGWCPGAYVTPKVVDITGDLVPGEQAIFKARIVDAEGLTYTNTCRPGAGDEQNLCQGCVFNDNPGNCDYDGGSHTAPIVRTTAQLLIYR